MPVFGSTNEPWAVLRVPLEDRNVDTSLGFAGEDIQVDLVRISRSCSRLLKHGRRKIFSEKKLKWGNESIKVWAMLMKEIYANLNLLRCVFRISNERLQPNEIARKTEKQLIVHAASVAHCRELLTMDNLCFGECVERDKKNAFCGKLIFCSHADRRACTSCIMPETRNSISSLTLGGIRGALWKPVLDLNEDFAFSDHQEIARYDYDAPDSTNCKILECHPIRILISCFSPTNFRIVSHRFVVPREDQGNIDAIDCLRACKQ